MISAPITAEALIAAFDLPPGLPSRRVPKATFADHLPTTTDKRLMESKLARLDWIAAINPQTSGIAAGAVDGLEIKTINLLLARTRGPLPTRLNEIVHRAIPQPVLLVHADEATGAPASLSLAKKRAAEREVGRVVVTDMHDTGSLAEADESFLRSLAVARLPSRDLAALYGGVIERTEALAAARAAGRAFRLAASSGEQDTWREALANCQSLQADIATLSAAMRKATRLAVRVERGEEVQRLRSLRIAALAMLA